MTPLAANLWRWTAAHPGWTPAKGGPGGWEQLVGAVAYAPAGSDAPLVLIDPMVPAEDAGAFWTWVDAFQRPIVIVPGNGYHTRSTPDIQARYGDRVTLATEAPGVRALPITGLDKGETAYLIEEHGALVIADALIGVTAHESRVAPPGWASDRALYESSFRAGLTRLLELAWERVLPSHGPMPAHGRRAFEAALVGPAWGKN